MSEAFLIDCLFLFPTTQRVELSAVAGSRSPVMGLMVTRSCFCYTALTIREKSSRTLLAVSHVAQWKHRCNVANENSRGLSY
jgi:hypothetical protein